MLNTPNRCAGMSLPKYLLRLQIKKWNEENAEEEDN